MQGQFASRKKRYRCAVILIVAFFVGRLVGHWHMEEDIQPAIRLADTGDQSSEQGESEVASEEELPKQIAITFDDGPNPYYTETLLEGLKKRGVKATFFLLGAEVEQYPDIVEHIEEDGHLIGVHSYEHVNFGQIGDEAAMVQIETTREAIHAITGEYSGFIRPPYGCWKDSLNEQVPMIEVLWDVDPLDWATTSSDAVAQRIFAAVEDGGTIILLHDASESSVQAAFTVIDTLKEQGYEFVTVEELIIM